MSAVSETSGQLSPKARRAHPTRACSDREAGVQPRTVRPVRAACATNAAVVLDPG